MFAERSIRILITGKRKTIDVPGRCRIRIRISQLISGSLCGPTLSSITPLPLRQYPSIKYSIPTKEASNVSMTLLGSGVSMGGGDHLYDVSPNHLHPK
ncbi:hypothetical protein EVAR_8450_1 [Eumeta japonica]|uniref:Uncharacterized protein n=1 Tax=Eumeta variegata TaxID=151549 RepID=A0A4C1WEE2_EUMVA|nr:hypothetical protein EVAR_8450_1 [Eumeta japonica]